MKYSIVTCTGGRPELFELCKRWVMRQTLQPDHWLVVSDAGDTITDLPSFSEFRAVPPRPDWYTGPGYLDPAWSLTWALGQVPKGNAAIIMEDDDLYFPHHCATLMKHVEAGSLVSYGDIVWKFNLPAARVQQRPGVDPTEGCVGIHPDAVQRYIDAMRAHPRWDPKDGIYKGFTKLDIKGVGFGLPGRAGTTNAHNPDHKKARIMRPDPGHRMFRKLAGKDADAYLSLLKR